MIISKNSLDHFNRTSNTVVVKARPEHQARLRTRPHSNNTLSLHHDPIPKRMPKRALTRNHPHQPCNPTRPPYKFPIPNNFPQSPWSRALSSLPSLNPAPGNTLPPRHPPPPSHKRRKLAAPHAAHKPSAPCERYQWVGSLHPGFSRDKLFGNFRRRGAGRFGSGCLTPGWSFRRRLRGRWGLWRVSG